MRKTLKIGDHDVTFECKAVTPSIYKSEFRRDFFGDIIKMYKVMPTADFTEISFEDLEHADFDLFSRLAFACFKTADRKTNLDYVGFLELYPEFSLFQHGLEIADLITSGLEPKKK